MRPIWIIVAGLALPTTAVGEPRYRDYRPNLVQTAPEGRGCVWYRQRLDCSRYCYWEVNGKRYCRERAREAYPQGIVEELFYASPTMK